MSSEVQIAVIDQQDTQIVLAVPGVQGATDSPISAGGTANQVLRKASSTNYDTDWSLVTNAMVDSSAAIAGTKISPNFGSQNVVTTGTSTAASFIRTSSSVPTNGLYLPSANNVAISTNGTGRLFVDASGNISAGNSTALGPLDIKTSAGKRIVYTSLADYASNGIIGLTDGGNETDLGIGGNNLRFFTAAIERLRITSAGLVGVGTSSPGFKLTIEDSTTPRIRIGDGVRHLNVDGGSVSQNAAIGTDYAGSFGIYTDGAANTRFHITSAGLVGIGTTSPGGKLVISDGSTTFQFDPVGGTGNILRSLTSGGSRDALLFDASQYVYSNGATEYARIDSSGRLLVGTSSSPTGTTSQYARLTVLGNTNSSTGYGSFNIGLGSYTATPSGEIGRITFTNNGGADFARIQSFHDGAMSSDNDCPAALVFSTTADGASSPTERMRIKENGNLLINTTTEGAGIGFSAKLAIEGDDVAVFKNSAGASANLIHAWNAGTSGNNAFFGFGTEGTYTARGSINYNRSGGVVAYNTTSDYRAKTLIGEIENPGETIDALKVYRGVMNGATVERPMLVAHEAQEVAPYCVTGEKDAVDENGNPIYQQMDHQVLVPLLIAEIQSLRQRVATLESA